MKWPPFHPEARREFDHALDHLKEKSSVLARRYVQRTMDVIGMLREFPEAGAPIGRDTRKFSLRPFSYDLIYLPESEEIFIVAFAHHMKAPGYWDTRV